MEPLSAVKNMHPGSAELESVIQNFSKIKNDSDGCMELLNQALDLYEKKAIMRKKLDKLYRNYIKGFYGYIAYERELKILLADKSEETFFSEIDEKISALITKIEDNNKMIFQHMYGYTPSVVVRKPVIQARPVEIPERKTFRATPEKIEQIKKSRQKGKDSEKWVEQSDDFSKFKEPSKKTEGDVLSEELQKNLMRKKKKDIFLEAEEKKGKVPIFNVLKSFIKAKEESIFDIGRNLKKDNFIKRLLLGKKTPEKDILAQKTVLSDRFRQLRKIRYDVKEDRDYNLGLLTEQVKSDIFAPKKANAMERINFDYNVSSFGALSNVLVKDASLSLINSFPDFFKQMYHNLRLANISILSNTYTNMMVLSTFAMTGIGFVLSFIFSIVLASNLVSAIANSLFFAVMFGAITFLGFMAYPHYKINKREQDIKTNLPFAIDHMSAVVSSGVAPSAMFKLIVTSKEYGEISNEIHKIVEYIDLFGYDLVTAMDAVAQLSPSDDLKDFFEGFISTIESGGDLKQYLREKADAMMVQYKLERQRYTDIISTFSDVYTGIMVASPLFFVAALSLISILGGGIGGVDINLIVILGTYVFIPLLNILFMVFIELTQPNV